jgi:hypothetical protein
MEHKEIVLPNPLWDLVGSCEECIASCCDLDAFYVDDGNIRKWLSSSSTDQLSRALQQLVVLIQQVQQTSQPIQCEQLGFWGTSVTSAEYLLDYFKDWEAAITSVLAQATDIQGNPPGTEIEPEQGAIQ